MKFTDCLDDIGKNELQNPVDLCVVTKTGQLVVADDSNGVIIFDKKSPGQYAFGQQLKEIRDVGSVAYNESTNRVYASIGMPPDNTQKLVEIDAETWETKRTLNMPKEPKMRSGFVHWITTSGDDIFVATGDNKTAVLWRVDVSDFCKFAVVMERKGDLEHPMVSKTGEEFPYCASHRSRLCPF